MSIDTMIKLLYTVSAFLCVSVCRPTPFTTYRVAVRVSSYNDKPRTPRHRLRVTRAGANE